MAPRAGFRRHGGSRMSLSRHRTALTAAAAVAVTALALLIPAGSIQAGDSWEREYTTNIQSLDSNVQYLAVTKLEVDNAKARKYLYDVLETKPWHLRTGAIEVLTQARGDALEDLRKEVKGNKGGGVREGIVLAFGQMKPPDAILPDLASALSDKDPDVRRAAIKGILESPTKDGVQALLGAWEKEKDWTVSVFFKDALEKLTKNFFGFDLVGWNNWWAGHKEKWKAPKKPKKPGEKVDPEEEKKEKEAEEAAAKEAGAGQGEEKREESTTQLRDVEIVIKEAGKGAPLFVLPDLYRNNVYFEKHLQVLEDVARLFYIDLPPMSKFRGLKNLGVSGKPYYPVDMVCDAFDELRKERHQEKIAILGHGMAAWVAMRYATKYPKNVSHLILVSTWPSNRAWDSGRQRVEQDGRAKKNPEQEHYAKSLLGDPATGKNEYEAKDPQEAEALERMGWTLGWADPKNTFAADWYKSSHVDMGGCWIPEFDVGKEKGSPVPTLIVYGSHPRSLWTNAGDATVLGKIYPTSQIVACPGSADMPFIEDHELFTKSVKSFFKKYPFKKGPSAAGEKKDGKDGK
jgi:pimeloyl-ACP methyl ester carboxylesterase